MLYCLETSFIKVECEKTRERFLILYRHTAGQAFRNFLESHFRRLRKQGKSYGERNDEECL